jgi:SAM-dependent methyltransferase
MAEPAWKRHLTEYNEGLGVVYERFVLNDLLDRIRARGSISTVLEAPLFGMAGVSGINSVHLAQSGCQVTLVDFDAERLEGVKRIWSELGLPCRMVHCAAPWQLPFPDHAFDLVWNHAALWHVRGVEGLLRELVRVSRRLILIAVPNRWQVGYILRKFVLDKEFFRRVDEAWVDMGRVRAMLCSLGVRLVEEGVVDVPPWPDTVMPAAEVLERLGIRSARLQGRFVGEGWQWSTMDYYLGRQPDLRERVMRYAFLDRAPLPWPIKAIWAHHRYIVGEVG